MLRAAALLPLLRELQRFDTIGHPTASVACYLEPDLSQNWTFTSEQTMTFQDTPRCVRQALDFKTHLLKQEFVVSPQKKPTYQLHLNLSHMVQSD